MAIRTEMISSVKGPRGVSSLLRKDLAVFLPRDRVLIVLAYLLAHHTAFRSEEVFLWLGIVLAGALALYVPLVEWHQETDRMLSSLPVRRATVVFSRYLSSCLALVVAGGAWVSSGFLLARLLSPLGHTPGMWATFPGVITFFLLAGMLLALYLPLYFRFGLGRGAGVFAALGFALYVLASVPLGVFAPGDRLQSWISHLTASIGPGWVLFLILGGLGAAMALSERLSVRWFVRRDL